ncbi:unnamed protein product [Orchesella dallaii]|uniref:Strawberry notch helicase C domain-containing protein n=1 Tax=Orchesella dallaii TaxID=48710 RepID=A0ABP1RNS7_9HEXA
MELITVYLQAKGSFICRALDQSNVTCEKWPIELDVSQRFLYNDCAVIAPAVKEIREKYNPETTSIVVALQTTGIASFNVISEKEDSKVQILRKFYQLSTRIGRNPADTIIECLGGRDAVSEILGRMKVQVRLSREEIEIIMGVKKLGQLRTWKIKKQAWIAGNSRRNILGSTGLSLHCDSKSSIKTRWVQVVIQVPWVPESAIQQLGRVNRSNHVRPPRYIIVQSNIPGEARFFLTFLERLSKLGAISSGTRATDKNLGSEFKFPASKNPEVAVLANSTNQQIAKL